MNTIKDKIIEVASLVLLGVLIITYVSQSILFVTFLLLVGL